MIAHYKFILQLQQNLGRFIEQNGGPGIDSSVVCRLAINQRI
jgi:hypothetical protein